MTDPLLLVAFAFVGTCVLMLACWLRQLRSGDAGIVDIAWAAAIGLSVLLYAAVLERGDPAFRALVTLLSAGWALRLAVNLYLRNRGRPEDGRYAAMRAHWGPRADLNLLWFFLAQAVLAAVFSLPPLAAMLAPEFPGSLWLALGIGVWCLSLAGEAIADIQLNRFRANPANRGRTCNIGLWRYSRHPNYFFEWLHWFAYPLLATSSPWWWVAWIGPLAMYVFVRHLTGVPYTELQAAKSRSDYQAYQATTSAFFPWPPRGA